MAEAATATAPSTRNILGSGRSSAKWPNFSTGVANLLDEGAHLEFRFHMTQKALQRTHDRVMKNHPSLRARSTSNNPLALCHNHSVLGSCELVTCRMLHAFQEDVSDGELARSDVSRMISLVDLRERVLSINTPRPSAEGEGEDMFDMF